jgi:hypothetical protein
MALVKSRTNDDPSRTRRSNSRYRTATANFSTILNAMYDVSIGAADRDAGFQRAMASMYFTRLVGLGTTLKRVLPAISNDLTTSDYWDLSSVAASARMIVEGCLMFFYLGVEEVPEQEWRDRLNIFYLHECTARIRMFREFFQDEAEARNFEKQRDELVLRLDQSNVLATMSPGRRQEFLRGQHAAVLSLDQIAEAMGASAAAQREWWRIVFRLSSRRRAEWAGTPSVRCWRTDPPPPQSAFGLGEDL